MRTTETTTKKGPNLDMDEGTRRNIRENKEGNTKHNRNKAVQKKLTDLNNMRCQQRRTGGSTPTTNRRRLANNPLHLEVSHRIFRTEIFD